MSQTFDFIVVGGGSAGCVLANRLSKDDGATVCLIEQGPPDRSPLLHVPLGFYKAIQNPRFTEQFKTMPEAATADRAMVWPRGRVLGGSSSINGLLYVRGQVEDFDDWASLGASGWGFDDVLEYFKRSEDNLVAGASDLHGEGGPLGVSEAAHDPLSDRFIEAAVAAGHRRNHGFNGPTQLGAGYYQLTVRNGRRASSSVAFLKPARDRQNLLVLTGRAVTRILIDGKRASGVLLSDGSVIRCRREVILAAGAIGSPHLLQLSGIGPAELLRSRGVNVVAPLAGVGRNMQDHYNAYLVQNCDQALSLNTQSRRAAWRLRAGLDYILGRGGQLAVGAARAGAFMRTDPLHDRADVQLHVLPFGLDATGALGRAPQYTITVCQLRPFSRGSLKLRSANWREQPELRPGFLTDGRDVEILLAGIRATHRVIDTAPLSEITFNRSLRADTPDDELAAYVRATGKTVFHLCGTCKMGTDSLAVVDHKLRVHSLDGLRVADASVMPTMISGNTNAATIMIGEKASDHILGNRH